MLNPLPYPLFLLQTAALSLAVHRPYLKTSAHASYPGSVMEIQCRETSRKLSIHTAQAYANYAICEPYGDGHVASHYWAASEKDYTGFSGLGLQLDLPSSSIKFDGQLKGSLTKGVVRLHGLWETFGSAKDEPYSCYWDIDVRQRYLDEPKMEVRLGRAIFGCLQDVLGKRLANIGLDMPAGIAHFEPVLQALYGADYFGSVGLALQSAPDWAENSSSLGVSPSL